MKCAFGCLLSLLLLLMVTGGYRLEAQVETATISGTATDTSGAAMIGVTIEAVNVKTNVSQTTISGAQGRYEIADLPVGDYSVKASNSGFQTVVRKGITLTVGAHPMVDFSMPVGRVESVVNVESQVSQVQTTTGAVSSLVTPEQVADLPLNGRNFQQLLSLAPGVQTIPAVAGNNGSSSSYYGAGTNYSIAGYRPEGQAILLDNEDIQGFFQHGAGSQIVGTSLGVEALQEFQVLTNTYSAQFGGTGAAVNSVTKSGTNSLHGSAYDYLRNSVLDARNFFDGSTIPSFRRNQFGGSLGGPAKKDKLFFFANYEGLRSSDGYTETAYVPDANARNGLLPCNDSPGATTSTCANGQLAAVPGGVKPAIEPYLTSVEPAPAAGTRELLLTSGQFAGYPTGFTSFTSVASQVVSENYALGRIDYTLGSKDSLFGRYVFDKAYQVIPYPFSLLASWPEHDNTDNQYFTVEEKHLISPTKINMLRFSFTRTYDQSLNTNFSLAPANDPMQFYPGAGRPDGQISISGGTSLGTSRFPQFTIVQNKFTGGDDLIWMHGAHSFMIGGSITRMQTNIGQAVLGGIFAFGSLYNLLEDTVGLFQGVENPSPTFNDKRYFREFDFNPYFQDDWKVSSKLTVNLGVRWEMENNAVCAGGVPCYAILNPFTSVSCPTWFATECGFSKVQHVLAANPNWRSVDPRIGLAWDPFGDHKTSIRAGFGIFHEPIEPRTYAPGYYTAPPSGSVTAVGAPFPFPASGGNVTTYSTAAGMDYLTDSVPHVIQYNLTIQRDLRGMVASVGYIGSAGVHLFNTANFNQAKPSLSPTSFVPAPLNCVSSSCYFNSAASASGASPAWGALNLAEPSGHSSYNGLLASLNRQIGRSLVGQLSYTYSHCISDGDATTGQEQAAYQVTDFYNQAYDRSQCLFNITQSFVANALYSLPFTGNRLDSGWQLSAILNANTGLPIDVVQGLSPLRTGVGTISGDRPNYSGAAGCSPNQILDQAHYAQKYVQWFNTACYAPTVGGVLGNVGRYSMPGPHYTDLDFAVHKDTKITERLSAQFRAECFNILNKANLGLPIPQLFTGVGGSATPASSIGVSGVAGQITATSGTSRQIQFALKLVF